LLFFKHLQMKNIFKNPQKSYFREIELQLGLGQLILVVTLFQKTPSKTLTFISIGSLGILLGFMFVIGLMSLNYKIIILTIPFIVVSVIATRHYRKIE